MTTKATATTDKLDAAIADALERIKRLEKAVRRMGRRSQRAGAA